MPESPLPNVMGIDLVGRFNDLRAKNADRDTHMKEVGLARSGEIHQVLPGVFPRNWSKPIIANILDTTARQLAENLARLPQIECVTSKQTSEASKKFAAKKTKVALYYVDHSRLKLQLYSGADWFFSFGAMPVIVEPDFEAMCPVLRLDSPVGAYWELDLHGRCTLYAKSWYETVGSLKAKFPELAPHVAADPNNPFSVMADNSQLEVVKMYYKDRIYLFVPEKKGLVLQNARNPLGKVPVVICERPRWDTETRGAFDDVMWVWLARARMAAYGLEAADKAIRAPIAVGQDVNTISFGPDAIIRANEPEKIRRVNLELPQSALIESQMLDAEIDRGTRLPKAAQGNIDASIITGQGVEALANTFSQQIATAQEIIGDGLRRALMMAFEYDERTWPNATKSINGTANGAPFTEEYKPAKDIKGDYSVSVTYGFISGMDPNRALVFLLQMRGDQAIDRDTLQRQLPFDIDVEQLQRKIDTEQVEDALKQGVLAYLAAAPSMAMQGGPDPVEALLKGAEVIRLRQRGSSIAEAIIEAFTPDPEEQAAPGPADLMAQALGTNPEATGLPGGTPPDQEMIQGGNPQMGVGGAPDLQMLLAGLTSGGEPNLQAAVSRRMPA